MPDTITPYSNQPTKFGQYKPNPQESTYAKIINQRLTDAHTHQYPFWNDFDRYYKLYESYVNEQRSIWQNKMFIPVTFSVIERFLPRFITNKPKVNYLPRLSTNDMDDGTPLGNYKQAIDKSMQRAKNVQALFDWQWDQVSRNKDGGMFLEVLRFVKDALITGTAIAKIPWKSEGRDTKAYNDKNEVIQKHIKYFDGPDFEVIDPYDFFFDPEAWDIQRASWVMHRTRKTMDELREINKSKGVEIYKNLNVLEAHNSDSYSQTDTSGFKYRRKVALGSGQVNVSDKTIDKHELIECWGLFPRLDGDGKPQDNGELDWRVVVLANRNVVVRDIAFPYWHGKKPFVRFTPFPRTYEFYGIPIIKHMERQQFYINEFVSQKFDNQVIELNQMLVVAPEANLEDWQLVWRPGGVIRARPEFVKPLPIGDVTGPIDQTVEYLNQTIQMATGLSDYYTGGVNAEETQNKTATGTQAIEQEIATRVQLAVQVFESQVIREIGYQWHGLNGQFIKLPQVIRVTGNDGKLEFPLIMPEEIRYEYDITPEAGSTEPVNPSLMAQKFIQTVELVQGNPVMAQNTDWMSVERELWERNGIKEGNKFMVDTPGSDPSQMQGGDQLAGGASQQGQGGGSPSEGANTVAGQLGQAVQGGQPSAGGAQGQNAALAGPAPKAPGTISTKFDDLTLREQEQWLKMLGIQADTQSRVQRFAKIQDQMKTDRASDLIDRHMGHFNQFQALSQPDPSMQQPKK